jgi:hypothetical protein
MDITQIPTNPYMAHSRSSVEEQSSSETEMNSRIAVTKPLEFVYSVLELILSERHFKNQVNISAG